MREEKEFSTVRVKKTSARQHIYAGKSTQKPLPNSPSLRRSTGEIPHPHSGLSSILQTTTLERSSSWGQDGEEEELSHLVSKDPSEVSLLTGKIIHCIPHLDSAAGDSESNTNTSDNWTAGSEEHFIHLTHMGKRSKTRCGMLMGRDGVVSQAHFWGNNQITGEVHYTCSREVFVLKVTIKEQTDSSDK